MPARRIHFTGRRRLTSQDVGINLHNEAVPLAFEIAHLSLQRHGLPGDALVRVEAYRQSAYMPFDLGTVTDLRLSSRLALTEFATPDAIRFRVKVTAVAGATEGQLLAVGDRIRPAWIDGGQESLLPVRPSGLDQEVFRLDLEDEPVLLINDKIDRWRDVSRDEHFVALVYPTVLRTILTRIVPGNLPDPDEGDDWRSSWIRFAKTHPGISDPPDDDEGGGDLSADDWIEAVVAAFCKRNRIYDTFVRRWNNEDGS